MDKAQKNWYLVAFLFLSVIGYACVSRVSQTPTVSATNLPSVADSLVATNSNATSTSTLLPTQDIQPTVTALPTLPLEDAKTLLVSIAQNNANCRFPCLWGFMPGENTVEDLRNFLIQFGEFDSPGNFYSDVYWFDDGSQSFFGLWEENVKMDILLEHNGLSELENLSLNVQGPRSGSPTSFPLQLKRFDSYLLPQVLSNHEQPSEIIIGPYPFDPDIPEQWLPMNLGLFYPEQGFYIEYILTKKTEGEYFIACPMEVTEFSIVVWDPMEAKTLLEIAKLTPGSWGLNENNLDAYYRSIEEVLSITPEEFYEKYKDSANTDCISVPMSFWTYQ